MLVDRKVFSSGSLSILLALGLLGLSGCQKPDVTASMGVSAAAPAPTAAVVPASGASAAAATLIRGIYTWGAEVETLSPCNTNKTYWLEGSEAMLAPLQEMAMKKADAANEAYQPIYVEVQANYAGQATDGFAVDYDGVMQLQAVQSSSNTVPADCKLLDLPASAVNAASSD